MPAMPIQIDFPEPPDLNDRSKRKEDFDRWYFDLKTCVIRELERLAELIDQKQDKE